MSAAIREEIYCAASFGHVVRLAYEAGYAAHGDLALGIDEYSKRLSAILSKSSPHGGEPEATAEALRKLHTSDLYLSTACALHREKAWCRFEELYRRYVNDLVTYICSTRSIAAEVRDSISVHLFLPDSSGQSRISSYDGRSSLSTWLRVIITNRLINEGHRKYNSVPRGELRPEFEDPGALCGIERCVLRSRYEELVCAALRSACESLSLEERELLLWRFQQEAQLGQIAKKLGVHQSTITRTLERIARKLRKYVVSNLGAANLDSEAIAECLSVLMDGQCQSVSILDYLNSLSTR